jgi:hypothetical protein
MKWGDYVYIKGFGDFGMNITEAKKRWAVQEKSAKRKHDYGLKKWKEKVKRESKRPKLEKVNNCRAQTGLKPLTLDEFIHITKKRKPMKLRTNSKIKYTFEILETLETTK